MRRWAAFLLLFVALTACDREAAPTPPPKSPPPWKDWLTIASNGDAHAQSKIGDLYFYGISIPRDAAKAAKWYRLAAEQNDPIAQLRLGHLAYIEHDYTRAEEWYRLAADQGLAEGYFALGWMYSTGRGVTKDRPEAERLWYEADRLRLEANRLRRER